MGMGSYDESEQDNFEVDADVEGSDESIPRHEGEVSEELPDDVDAMLEASSVISD